MASLGYYARLIRKSRQLTLKQAANGIVSEAFLSKFERGENDMSAEKFLQLLDRLNATFWELARLIDQNDQCSQTYFYTQLKQAVVSDNIYQLNVLINKEEELYQEDHNYRHKHNSILLGQFINKISQLPFDTKKTNQLIQYLLSVEEWGDYEVSLFSNSLFFFPINKIELLSRTAMKRIKMDYQDSYQHVMALVMLNSIYAFLQADELIKAQSLINQVQNLLKNSRFYYENNKLNFYKGYLLIKQGKIEKGKKIIQSSILIMNQLGDYENAKAHEQELGYILKIN
ncbi:MAG: hypothetical protein Q4A67_02735 [Aerococcus sp.]|nr:hypothetical protein [Aerococcus sp.]